MTLLKCKTTALTYKININYIYSFTCYTTTHALIYDTSHISEAGAVGVEL